LATPIGLFAGCGLAIADSSLVAIKASHRIPILTPTKIKASVYRLRAKLCFAFLNAAAEPARPKSHATKPEANGKATRWHGYTAREGFGNTRIRNHISDNNPTIGNVHINQGYFLLVFGRTDGMRFPFKNGILVPP